MDIYITQGCSLLLSVLEGSMGKKCLVGSARRMYVFRRSLKSMSGDAEWKKKGYMRSWKGLEGFYLPMWPQESHLIDSQNRGVTREKKVTWQPLLHFHFWLCCLIPNPHQHGTIVEVMGILMDKWFRAASCISKTPIHFLDSSLP